MQLTATPETHVWDDLDAVDKAQETYIRRIPLERAQGHGWLFVSLARFENADAAKAALRDIEDDDFSSVREYWPSMDVAEIDVSLGENAAYRRLLSGTIGRDGESLFSDFLELRVDDVVALITGYSSYAPITLETSYMGYIVYSLIDMNEDCDLAQLLPRENMLIGGITVSD